MIVMGTTVVAHSSVTQLSNLDTSTCVTSTNATTMAFHLSMIMEFSYGVRNGQSENYKTSIEYLVKNLSAINTVELAGVTTQGKDGEPQYNVGVNKYSVLQELVKHVTGLCSCAFTLLSDCPTKAIKTDLEIDRDHSIRALNIILNVLDSLKELQDVQGLYVHMIEACTKKYSAFERNEGSFEATKLQDCLGKKLFQSIESWLETKTKS